MRVRPGRDVQILASHKGRVLFVVHNFREKTLWRLAEMRIDRTELARRLGTHNGRVSSILSSRSLLLPTLERLSEALEWPVERWQRLLHVPRSPAKWARKRLAEAAERRCGLEKSEHGKTFTLHRLAK